MSSSSVRLRQVRQEIERERRNDRRQLKGAVVGRPIDALIEKAVNDKLPPELSERVRYMSIGHFGLIYITRKELSDEYGKSFFSNRNIASAIQQAPTSAFERVSIGRGEVSVVEKPFRQSTVTGNGFYWLTAHVLSARFIGSADAPSVDTRREESAIATDLFRGNTERTLRQVLWLGAVAAQRVDDVYDALDSLDGILPSRFRALPVALMPNLRDAE